MNYSSLRISIQEKIATVSIDRPQKVNALHQAAWEELKSAFDMLSAQKDVRVIVLSGEGKLFCAGIDLELLMSVKQLEQVAAAERTAKLYSLVRNLQDSVTAIENCQKPVLAAIHNGCIGGGVDIISACDLRYCTDDAYFTIKEIDMGMVADLGTLQRLPKFAKPAVVAEMAFTGRPVFATEAHNIGLVNAHYETKEIMMEEVMKIAVTIASKSPVSVRGTKEVLRQARDHSVPEGLEFIAQWNSLKLLSHDLIEAFTAVKEKRKPHFED